MPGTMPLQAGEGISSSAAPEPQPRAPRSRALLGRAVLGICFFGIYLLLTRSDIILQARSGFSVWYPANGLAFAFRLGISPWYAPLAAVADFLSAVLFYHERMLRGPWRSVQSAVLSMPQPQLSCAAGCELILI